jgi:hypothetical protein
MKRYLIPITALTVGLALIFAATAFGSREVARVGNLILADNGGIFPSTLPKRRYAPITARIAGEVRTVDGSHPPAVRTVSLDVDKTIGIDGVGLPACKANRIEARTTADAKRACNSAIVGSGRGEVEVAFPEQAPFSASGPVVIFNGGVHGRTTLVLLHAYVAVPAPTAIVTMATVTRINRGRFGLHIEAQIPRIAGGAGSVTKFELKVGRKFTYRGKRKSFLVGSCPTGSWVTKGNVLFDDGTELGLTHVFPCTPAG